MLNRTGLDGELSVRGFASGSDRLPDAHGQSVAGWHSPGELLNECRQITLFERVRIRSVSASSPGPEASAGCRWSDACGSSIDRATLYPPKFEVLAMTAIRWATIGLLGIAFWPLKITPAVEFKKIRLTDTFYAEAAGLGDIDRDGHGDAIYGPHWYAGPDFARQHQIYPPEKFLPQNYSQNFATFVHDINGDQWLDVIVNVWPGKEVFWFQNPGEAGGAWQRHLAYPTVDNESPHLVDITGDGKKELIFHTGGVLGFAGPTDPTGVERWLFHPCSDNGNWRQYQHGLGVGDLNGDGRPDLLMAEGWWEQPAVLAATPWQKHPFTFAQEGAQMHVYDVDGDGDGDVITSLAAHGYGLSWFEQIKKDGAIDFIEHAILPAVAEKQLNGVQFSQPHALEVVDVNGDGLKDIVTGKRYWAHGPTGDVDATGPAVLYWFELARGPAAAGTTTVHYSPHLIDSDSGIGTQFVTGDLNGDGQLDIVTGNKKGGFVFLGVPQAL